jgi:hypothetical protein
VLRRTKLLLRAELRMRIQLLRLLLRRWLLLIGRPVRLLQLRLWLRLRSVVLLRRSLLLLRRSVLLLRAELWLR